VLDTAIKKIMVKLYNIPEDALPLSWLAFAHKQGYDDWKVAAAVSVPLEIGTIHDDDQLLFLQMFVHRIDIALRGCLKRTLGGLRLEL
jgi:hypothetical protein